VLDAGAVAFLGIGRTPPLVARLGLWDADTVIPPDVFPSGLPQPGKLSRLRHAARADTALHLRCAVSSAARLAIPADVVADVAASLDSTAALRLGATAEIAAGAAIAAGADVRDVVLEMLLLVD
jgi:hypothetical protein